VLVQQCCEFDKYKDSPVCNKCAATPIPDIKDCCSQVIENNLVNYKTFTSCCLQPENENHKNC